ncbi:allophanate hydrolase subunit 1 [Alloalcanivorax gelatiniphagus]
MDGVRTVRVGARACLVEVGDAVAAASLASWARASGLGAGEIVPAAATVLFDDVDPDDVEAALPHWPTEDAHRPGPLVRLPVVYDGPDLDAVADHWRCPVAEVVRVHTSLELVAVFSGFAPGFSYLAGLPTERAVPRLSTPRPRVAAGSVGLADTWCGVYPTASPGGWLLVGSTDEVLWDADREQPALLAPGTRVRFVDAGRAGG